MDHSALKNMVGFIRPTEEIPDFDVPAYAHDRYEQWIPDTLDIQERCALAVNGLTGPTDPDKGYLLYFYTNFSANPPMMTHNKSDICQVKFMESLPLMRLASGSGQNSQVDPVWMATALRMIGPDGLAYWPALPWAPRADWSDPCPNSPHYAVPAFVGRMLGAMALYMLQDPAGPWRREGERVVEGLRDVAIDRGEWAYFPQGAFAPGATRPRDAAVPIGIWSSLPGWTTQGLTQFFRASGYAPAGELAGKLAHYIRDHGIYYGPHGEFLSNWTPALPQEPNSTAFPFDPGPKPAIDYIHFQHHMVPLLGMLDYALAAGDSDMAAFVRSSFEWARGKGETTVGYFPENVYNAEYEGSETCEVAGMIGLALKLSAAGIGDYWDDADRWIRNQFAENQMRRADWAYRMHNGGLVWPRRRVPQSQIDPLVQSSDHVPERNVGAFAGWPAANDFFNGQGDGIMHCCTGNGTRALYYAWEHILTWRAGELRVNLLLNRPSQWADIHSHIPYAGQVDVLVKQACTLKVRIPDWVAPADLVARIGEQTIDPGWEGRYAVVGQVSAGDAVTVSFPISERVVEVDIEKQHYVLTLKGHEVVQIDPPGRFCPFYQRDVYREPATRWRKAQRFVPRQEIVW